MAKASKVARYNLLQAFNDIYGNTYRAYQSLVLWMEMTPVSPTDASNNASTAMLYENTPTISQVVLGPDSIQKYWSATFSDVTATNAVALNTDGNFCFTSLASLGTPTATSDRPFSISFWAKITPVSVPEYLFAKQYTGVTDSYEYRAYWSGGFLFFVLKDMDSTRFMGRRVLATSWTGAWHHFVFTYDGGGSAAGYPAYSEGLRIYVDGTEVATANYTQSGYVGMKPNFSGALYIGTNEISSWETDAQMAEFAVWSKQMSAIEIKAIYNASLEGSTKLSSGFLNNPPRTILQACDNATGSYPTVSRVGDPGRTGRYNINFNDTSTVVFSDDTTVSYPTDLTTQDQAYIDQHVATPNTNSTIEATGTVRKGVADANITFTPGEDLKPFVEDRLYASTKEAFTDPFYITGSTVANVGPGFTSPLRSKTKIEIDLESLTANLFGIVSGSDPASVAAAGDLAANPNMWPMVYYNFNTRQFEKIGLGVPTAMKDGSGGTNDVASAVIYSASVGFSRGTELMNEGLSAQCRPTSTFGFPSNFRYHATSSNLYPLSNIIDTPFLVEKFVYEFSTAYGIGSDHSYRDSMFKRSGAGIAEDRIESGYASIATFFILNQRNPMSIDFHQKEVTPNLNFTGIAPVSSVAALSLSSSIPTTQALTLGGPDILIDTYRDLVTYGQFVSYVPGTGAGGFSLSEAIETGGLGRELNILTTTNSTITGSYVMSGTVKTTPAYDEGPVVRMSKYPDFGNDRMVIPLSYQGTRSGILMAGSRGLTAQVSGAEPTGSMHDFGAITAGQGTSDHYVITTYKEYDNISPYILQPADNLIFGWQFPLPMAWNRAADAGTGPNMQITPGKGKLTLYGSLITDGHEYHDGLNQPLTSDAVHDFVGFHGPPLDQFDTESRQQFSGSYISNNVGKVKTVTVDGYNVTTTEGNSYILGDSATMTWSAPQTTIGACTGDVLEVVVPFRPSSQFRNVRLSDSNEKVYDCFVPGMPQMFEALGKQMYIVNFTGNHTAPNKYQLLINIFDASYGSGADTNWWARFPFEPVFAGLKRQLHDPLPSWRGRTFQCLGNYNEQLASRKVFDEVLPQNLSVNGTRQPSDPATTPERRAAFTPSVEAKRALLGIIFGCGDGLYGKVGMYRAGDASGPFISTSDNNGPIRGFKYGIYNTHIEESSAYFRPTNFGQFRDMMEQRQDTRFYMSSRGRTTITSSPVNVRFVSADGTTTPPPQTFSSNLSQYATSSLPYFDGVARNRGPIVTAEVGMTVVGI
jgi:hypothetical protein